MSSSISVKVNAAGRSLPELTIPEGAGRSGRTLRFKVPANSRVEMLDPLTGLGPEQIQVKRVGQALHVAFKGSDLTAPDLVLEEFFKGKDEDRSRLLGKISGNDTQDYVPADSSTGQVSDLADGGRGSTYTLHDAAHAAVAGGSAGAEAAAGAGGLGTVGVVAGVVVVAGVAAGGGGGGGGGGGDAAPAASSDTQAPAAPGDVRVLAQADGRVLVTGVAEAGSTVIVRFPDGTDKAVAAQADGRFEVSSDAIQSSGNVSAQARDAAGNTGPPATAAYADTTAPAAPALGFQANADGTATASGTAEAGARVEIRFPNQSVVAVLADATGHFAATSGGAAGNGDGSAVAVDAAGNASARTTATLKDDAPPSATASITGAVDDFAPLTGALASGATTNDRTPRLEGSLSAGLEAGSVLAVLRGGQQVGQAQVTGTRWTFQDAVRTDGTVSYTVQAVDPAGNRGAASAPFTLNIDSTPPGAPTIDQATSDAGGQSPVPNGGATRDTSPTLQGSLPAALAAGQILVILRDGVEVKSFDQSGRTWSFDEQPLADGTYTYLAEVREAATGEVSRSNTFTLGIDRTPPRVAVEIQTLTDDVPLLVGAMKNGTVTNDTAPLLSGTLSGPLAAGEQVLVTRDGLQTPLVATVNGTTWSVQESGLQGGQAYTYHAHVVDAAGNAGASSAAFQFSVDTTAPNQSATFYSASPASSAGASASSGDALATDSPNLRGILQDPLGRGELIVVYRDGTALGPATTDGDYFGYVDHGLSDGGRYSYTTRVEDSAGNQGPASRPFVLSIDTSPPRQSVTINAAADDVGTSTGTVANGGRTDDARPTLQGSLSAPLAAGESITILRDGNVIADSLRPAGQTWSHTEAHDLTPGEHSYSAHVVNAAGQAGPESAAFVLTEAPDPVRAQAQVTEVTDNVSPELGTVANGGATNDTSPQIHGSLSEPLAPGEAVYVHREGQFTPLLARVDGTRWVVDDTELTDGRTYHYTAQAVRQDGSFSSGNLSALVAAVPGYAITVDTRAPAEVVWMAYDFPRKDGHAQVYGSVEGPLGAGESVVIFRKEGNGAEVEIGRVQPSANDFNWSFDDAVLVSRDTSYVVRIVDAAGNQGRPADPIIGVRPDEFMDAGTDLALVHGDLMWTLPQAAEPAQAPEASAFDHAAGSLLAADLLLRPGTQEGVI